MTEPATGWLPDGFYHAPRDREPTPQERINCVLRLVDKAKRTTEHLREIVAFEHGTVVVVLTECPVDAEAVMRHYDVPLDGEGGAPGDIDAMPINDGSVLYTWAAPSSFFDGPKGCQAISPLGAFEWKLDGEITHTTVPPSPTEVFQTSDRPPFDAEKARGMLRDFMYGRICRHRRTLDAQNPVAVARWTPEEGPTP